MYYFDWDENKNRINLEKHGITFEEASTVFFDDRAILFDDPEHSIDEDRFLLLGMSETAKVCIVCHCYRESDTVIRIISARQARNSSMGQLLCPWSMCACCLGWRCPRWSSIPHIRWLWQPGPILSRALSFTATRGGEV